jgi:hypothetical protein
VVVGVGNHYVFVVAQAKAVGRIELALVGPQLPKLAAYLHWSGLAGSSAAHLLREGRHRVVAIANQVQIIWCGNVSLENVLPPREKLHHPTNQTIAHSTPESRSKLEKKLKTSGIYLAEEKWRMSEIRHCHRSGRTQHC